MYHSPPNKRDTVPTASNDGTNSESDSSQTEPGPSTPIASSSTLINQAEEILTAINQRKPTDSGISVSTMSDNMQALRRDLLGRNFSTNQFMPPNPASSSSTTGNTSQSLNFSQPNTSLSMPDNTVVANVPQREPTLTQTAASSSANHTVALTAPVPLVSTNQQPTPFQPISHTVQHMNTFRQTNPTQQANVHTAQPRPTMFNISNPVNSNSQQDEASYVQALITTLHRVNSRPSDPLNHSIQDLLTQEIARQTNRNVPVSSQHPIYNTSASTTRTHTTMAPTIQTSSAQAPTVQAPTAHQWQMPPPFMYPNYYAPYMYQAQQPQQPRVDPIFAKTEMPKINSKNTEQSIAKLEEWLHLNGVTDDNRKYSTLKMQLDSSTYSQVGNVLYQPPETGKYDALKKAVIKVFTDSETKRMQNLIDGLQLGDKKPSMLLTEMRNLHRGKSMDETIFTQLWMKRLPSNVTSVLGALTKTLNANTPPPTLEQLAEAADSIMENAQSGSNNINSIANTSKNTSHIDDLQKTIQSLNEQVKWLTNQVKGQHQSRSQSRSRSRSQSRNRTASVTAPAHANAEKPADAEPTPCSFHKKYGQGEHKNRKCFPDCSLFKEWSKANNYKPKNE